MRVLSFVRYSFESVLRNRRRSLFAIIGIVLALSLMAGSWIAVDSSGYGLLRAAIDKVKVDFIATDTNPGFGVDASYLTARIDAIESVADVEQAIPVARSPGWLITNGTDFYYPAYSTPTILFLPAEGSKILSLFNINDTLPAPGTAAIPKAMADALDIGIGDGINVSMYKETGYYDGPNGIYVPGPTTYLNLTFQVSRIWYQPGGDNDEIWSGDYGGYYYKQDKDDVIIGNDYNPIVLNMDDSGTVIAQHRAFETWSTPELEFYIWIDRDRVISIADIPGTVDRLEFIEHRLDAQGRVYGFVTGSSGLIPSLQDMVPQLEGMKLLFIGLSLPVVALGTYLSVIGVDLGVTTRRREVGILKSRGASNRQVFGALLLESSLLGTLAGLVGLLLGIGISRFLMDSAVGLTSTTRPESSLGDLSIGSSTIIMAILFGVLLMLLSSYRPFKKISKMEVAEALHHYSATLTHLEYKPARDIVMLSLSIWSVISISWGVDWTPEGGSWIVTLILIVLVYLGIILFPIMPFLLSLSIVRLTTRSSHRLYAKLTLLVKPWTKELHYLVDRNIVRNPKRASNLAVIISLALTFGLFISVTMESTLAYQRELVKYDVGADVKMTGYWSDPDGTQGLSFRNLSSVGSIVGVDELVMYRTLYLTSDIDYLSYHSMQAIIMDTTNYSDVVHPSDFYFVGSGNEVLKQLKNNGTALMSRDFAISEDILVGDAFLVYVVLPPDPNSMTGSYDYIPLVITIVGLVKGLPGISTPTLIMDESSLSYVPESNLTRGGYEIGFLFNTEQGVDPHVVADDVDRTVTAAGVSLYYTSIMVDEIDRLNKDMSFGALSDFLYMEYALSMAIMSVGVGLIIFVAVSDREQELACIMARGSSGSQMRKILMGESVSLMSLGLIVGTAVGLVTAYLFNTLMDGGSGGVVERTMVFTFVSWAAIGIAIASLLIASLVATSRAGKLKLAEVLRIRGG
jgi:ABC-type antimicrobial peptide transport system permease subunit